MVMTDGGSNYDLSDYVERDVAKARVRKDCVDFGNNPSFSFTDNTLMKLGYQMSDQGRITRPSHPQREYASADRKVPYNR